MLDCRCNNDYSGPICYCYHFKVAWNKGNLKSEPDVSKYTAYKKKGIYK